jgi:hypothetical protein
VLYCAVRFACVVAVDAAEDAVAADPAAALALDDASPALIFAVFALFDADVADCPASPAFVLAVLALEAAADAEPAALLLSVMSSIRRATTRASWIEPAWPASFCDCTKGLNRRTVAGMAKLKSKAVQVVTPAFAAREYGKVNDPLANWPWMPTLTG